jgi:protein-tyrosine phosphatase
MQETLGLFLEVCEGARPRREGVAVHCRAGMGRTGTCLAAYLMRFSGLSARQAISAVRRARPGSVESRQQEKALESFQTVLKDSSGANLQLPLKGTVSRARLDL